MLRGGGQNLSAYNWFEVAMVMKKSSLATLLFVFVAMITAAQVYKWVDEEGEVHFGDRPPENTNPEELVVPEGPSSEEIEAAQEELRRTIELQKEREKVAAEKRQILREEKRSKSIEARSRFNRCVVARQQFVILGYKVRVFKIMPDWSRKYLSNDDRPQEISKFSDLANEYCDTDPESRRKQVQAVLDLGSRLKITCIAPREKIAAIGKPTTEADAEKIAEYEAYVRDNCPPVDYQDMWIADRVYVR
jgi:Domain of unknown function (DUF4124)